MGCFNSSLGMEAEMKKNEKMINKIMGEIFSESEERIEKKGRKSTFEDDENVLNFDFDLEFNIDDIIIEDEELVHKNINKILNR